MTWPAWLPRLRPWLVPVLLVVAALVAVWSWNRAGRLSADLDQAREAAELRARDLVVEAEAKRRELEARAADLARQNRDLADELERARAAAPGARVTGTVQAVTRPGAAGGEPRACPAPPPGASCPAPPACLLAAGDLGQARVDQVELQTRSGNRILAGAASCWRMEPGPPARLFGGSFSAELSAAAGEAPEEPPRWGAGVAVYAGRDGWAVGPAVALPPLRLWGMQGEAVIGAGAGPTGTWQAGGTAVLRW